MQTAKIRTITGANLHAACPAAAQGSSLVAWSGKNHAGQKSVIAFSSGDMGVHSLFLGPSGCGKTNCIGEALRQVQTRLGAADSMLVFDPKGDYVHLAQPGDSVVSTCGSTDAWNIFADISADGWDEENLYQNALEVAETIFAQAIQGSSQQFFPRAAKGVFCDVLATMACIGADDKQFRRDSLNNACLADYLQKLDAQRLRSFLGKSRFRGSLKYIGDGTSDQALGVFAELQEVVGSLFVGDFGGTGILSARRMQRSGGRALFVEYDHARMASPAYSVIVDLYIKEALSQTSGRGSVYVFLDELPLVPHLQFLQKALTFGRSKGLKIIGGVQSLEQLYDLYGEHGGRCLAAGFQNVFAFRCSDESTRHYVSGLHGESLKEISFISSNTGRKESELRLCKVVEDSDIMELGLGSAIVSLLGRNPFLFTFDRYSWNKEET